jgi:hypothetical protein
MTLGMRRLPLEAGVPERRRTENSAVFILGTEEAEKFL